MTWAVSHAGTWHAFDGPLTASICGRGKSRTPLVKLHQAYEKPMFPLLGKRVCKQCSDSSDIRIETETMLDAQPPKARAILFEIADEAIRAKHRGNTFRWNEYEQRGYMFGATTPERCAYGYTKAEVELAKKLLENAGYYATFDLIEGLLMQAIAELRAERIYR